MSTPKARMVHFSITGEFITGHVRNLWAEGSYDKAFRTLEAAFPEMDFLTQSRIISGTKRLEGVNDLTLIDDNWKPDLSRCAYRHYPSPLELPKAARTIAARMLDLEKALREKEMEIATLSDTATPRGAALAQIHQRMWGKPALTAQQYVENLKQRDEREASGKPIADPQCQSAFGGWVLPDGRFYGCQTEMEHVWLPQQLGKSEHEGEQLGWVKISTGILGTYILAGRREPNQAQINTVSIWCERHKRDLPVWAGGKE